MKTPTTRTLLIAVGMLTASVATFSTPLHAETRKQELQVHETFSQDDAQKAQPYIDAAMTTPMLDLLSKADVTRPATMLEYGLALELGREPVSSQMSTEDKEKLKRGFREMLDLYLNSSDKFGNVSFKEDSMLDMPEFWIILAEHIGRPKPRVDERAAQEATVGGQANQAGAGNVVFIPDAADQDQEFNLNQDLILDRQVVNAATTCADSAMGFARMKKVQMLDITTTKLTPDQFAQARQIAVKNYLLAYQEGSLGCGSRAKFLKTAEFARQNLGRFGQLKEDPNAVPAPIDGDTPSKP